MADIISPSLSSIEKTNIAYLSIIILQASFRSSDVMYFSTLLKFLYYLFLVLEFIFVKFYAKIVYALSVTFFNLTVDLKNLNKNKSNFEIL